MLRTVDDLLDRSTRERHGDEAADMMRESDAQVIAGGAVITDDSGVTAINPDNDHRYLWQRFPVRDPDGEPIGVGGMMLDLTDRLEAERALRETEARPALVGFDDFELADLLGVTVVSHDPERLGDLAAERITGRLAAVDPARARRIAVGLVERRPDPALLEIGHGAVLVRLTPHSVVLSDAEGTAALAPLDLAAAVPDPKQRTVCADACATSSPRLFTYTPRCGLTPL